MSAGTLIGMKTVHERNNKMFLMVLTTVPNSLEKNCFGCELYGMLVRRVGLRWFSLKALK